MNVEVAYSQILTDLPDPPEHLTPGTLARMSWVWDRLVNHLGAEQANAVVSWVETHQPRTPTRDRDQLLALTQADREFLLWALGHITEGTFPVEIRRRAAKLAARLKEGP